jgi:hypothetical protein
MMQQGSDFGSSFAVKIVQFCQCKKYVSPVFFYGCFMEEHSRSRRALPECILEVYRFGTALALLLKTP